jgi:hypothetical protein
MKNLSFKLFLFLLGAWLFCTILVDFVAVPAVFQTVTNRFEAGDVGMQVFTRLNFLEVIFSVLLLTCAFLFRERIVWRKIFFTSLFSLMGLALYYSTFLSPEIIKLTIGLRDGVVETPAYQAIEARHAFYHQLYIRLDSFKLLILVALSISVLKKREGENL